ncbi:MobF family relaxase [Parafrigoribacterium mesophilum]|uniref:MobF family relaxase n=1 Tax=Parafrigoribacterium mesophilum TaxID=433646 RepID=UPI0031FD1275
MRVMSAGDGYKYLLKSVAAGDGDRDLSTPLIRYYAETGTPPGFWLGEGVRSLGQGELEPGDAVSEAQLQLLLGMGRDPITGAPLGRAFPAYRSVAERIRDRVAGFDAGLSVDERAAAVTAIEAGEAGNTPRRAVAGYDYTFSVPKSVSVLWGLANADTQSLIATAHHQAVADVVGLMEREVAATRTGVSAGDGAVAQVEVTGLIAMGYDHYDSRAGDPQLHTHVVISNKVRTVYDEGWRSLDGRPMHAAVHALSAHYNAVLADHLTRVLGVGWERRDRGRDRTLAWEIARVPEELIEEFSSRSRDINVEADRLIDKHVAEHGRRPAGETIVKLRAQATLSTRPAKQVRSLAELTAEWRKRAADTLGTDAATWVTTVLSESEGRALLHAGEVPLGVVAELGRVVVAVVGEKQSTWRRWNLHAEASRQTMGWRFATTQDREAIVGMITDAAESASLRLTPPELASSPSVFQRGDGTSVFRPKNSVVFSSEKLLAAEDRLLKLSRTTDAPTVGVEVIERIAHRRDTSGRRLAADQAAALAMVAASGRTLDLLVGPAGAGKTTAMNALRRAWESQHGEGSVIGLAPSAAAAQVLAEDLGIATENTAMWITRQSHGQIAFHAGQLVIVDEASLAGTFTLDTITAHAAKAGAKVLLIGDWAQLDAVDAGGSFGMLVRDRDHAPELVDIHRFRHEWEKTASRQLRIGDAAVIDTYQEQGRIREGESEAMLDAAYTAWRADLAQGLASVMIAETHDIVTALNNRARLDRIIEGTVATAGAVRLHDGTEASAGDLVVTRHNDRRLRACRGFVKNGDRWTITATGRDGSATLRRAGHRFGASATLPASYVADELDLGYALTAHRAQGSTVDTAHAIVQSTAMTREAFYVAMTRGRQANTAYVATDHPDDTHAHPHPDDQASSTARAVLSGVLQHVGAEPSGHETIRAEHEAWSNIAQLAAEYETIAAAAQRDRWIHLVQHAGLTERQVSQVIESPAFRPLTAALRRAEAFRHDVDVLLPRLVAARGFEDADDIAAVLHHRLAKSTSRRTGSSRGTPAPRLIAGLIPEATGSMSDEMRQALAERQRLIEQRATALAQAAVEERAAWMVRLGQPSRDRRSQATWTHHVRTIVAYRDRYQVTAATNPLGAPADGVAQRLDRARAETALTCARQLEPKTALQMPSSVRRQPDLRL